MRSLKAIILLMFVLAAMQINAQSSIKPISATVHFDNGSQPCIQVNLDPEPETLKHAWKDYLKDNYDLKLKGIGFLSSKDLLSAEEVNVNQVSSKTMDFYTQIVEDENGSEMKVFVRLGYGIYVGKENFPMEYEAINEILESFLKYYLPIYYNSKVNDTEKRLEQLTDESEDLEEKIADNSENIAEFKKEIGSLEQDTKTNNERLEVTNDKLTKRREKLVRIRTQLQKM